MVQLQELKEKLAAANAKNEETLAALEAERAAHTQTWLLYPLAPAHK